MENGRTKEEWLVEMDNWFKASGWTKDKAPVWTEDQVKIVYGKNSGRLSAVSYNDKVWLVGIMR